MNCCSYVYSLGDTKCLKFKFKTLNVHALIASAFSHQIVESKKTANYIAATCAPPIMLMALKAVATKAATVVKSTKLITQTLK